MAEKLTPQQKIAVENRGGKLLVSAAAGSGKTKVLVDRLLSYILDPMDPANIDDFLVITYTKAAASELRGKIANKLSEHIASDPTNLHLQRQLQRLYLTKISTVHSFCSDILREYAYRLDVSGDFHVGDENECTQLRQRALELVLENAYETVADDTDFAAFVDTQGLGRNDSLIPQIIEKIYDSARCHLDYEGWLDGCMAAAEADGAEDASQTLWGQYLVRDLFVYLDLCIASMDECLKRVSSISGLEKAAANLSDTLMQLRKLRESATWDEIIARKNIDYGRLTFAKKADDPMVTEPVKTVRKACRDGLEKKLKNFTDSSRQILSDLNQSAAATRGLVRMVRSFAGAYDDLKRGQHVLDFGDLEHKTLDLLLGKRRSVPTLAAMEIGKRFREIMVDEYQDSNAVQDAIFAALTEKRQNLFMVGDVKQSIYQFRLADPGIFLEKYASFGPAEEAEPGQGRKVLLSKNFRSSAGVIHAVNDVFYDCMSERVGGLDYTDKEALIGHDTAVTIPETTVELYGITVKDDTYDEEAAFVAQHIKDLTDGTHCVRDGDKLRPVGYEDIVILLRSPSSVGHRYIQAMERVGIPCTMGGGIDLLLTDEISALRALLQIISNPRQDIPLVAALASPVFCFTADDLAALRAGHRKGYIYDSLKVWDGDKRNDFFAVFNQLRQDARLCTLPELLERIFTLTNLESIYGAMPGGENRQRNIRAFYTLGVQYDASGPKDLEQFLSHLDAMEEKGLITAQDQSGNGCVTIMSIHKSKGLEFPVVFLCGLSRRFNRESLKAQVLCDMELGLGLSCLDAETRVRYPTISKQAISVKTAADSLSEEMRVLYVALTRAKDRLIMTFASNNLEGELRSMAQCMDICPRDMITSGVSCPGQWVLYSAMKRTEAGAFFALADHTGESRSSEFPWKIAVGEAGTACVSSVSDDISTQETFPPELTQILRKGLEFSYAHMGATAAPSKQTATQRKGRVKDQEASENSNEPDHHVRTWRKPLFVSEATTGTEFGTAIHAAMQYVRYEACDSEEHIRSEIDRLVEERFLTQQQGSMVDCTKLAAFFMSDIGKKLRESGNVLREFKFSILNDGAVYGDGLEGEYVLLQGVVDCALIEDDGITVIDFKTDRVTLETLTDVTARYTSQVEVYADALRRIFELPVKAKALYFFRINRFVWL